MEPPTPGMGVEVIIQNGSFVSIHFGFLTYVSMLCCGYDFLRALLRLV